MSTMSRGLHIPSLTGLDRETFVVIGHWRSEEAREIVLQEFESHGERFIPLFSDADHFATEVAGSGFERQGIEIDREFLLSMLGGDELLILNPGSSEPFRLRKADITP